MEYYTYCSFRTLTGTREEQDIVMDELTEIFGCEIGQLDSQELKWHIAEPLVIEVAKKHPIVMIEVSGDGEDELDFWISRYLGEHKETVAAFIPPFRLLKIEGEN